MAVRPSHVFVQQAISWLTELSRLYIRDLDMESRVRIVVSELTENVAKYGTGTTALVNVDIEQRSDDIYLRVETSNTATARDIERAVDLLREIKESTDPIAYYDDLIRAVAPTRIPGVSGLGLARIRAEGDLDLGYHARGGVLTIRVETPIGAVGRG
jgi:hypothetical protein